MNPNHMANHRRGEKAKLLAAVEELCARLNRPICSGDLRAFFHKHPDRRPCLLKRLGQQLIVAAEAQDGVVPHLKKFGVFRHKVYYALEDTPVWRQRFTDFCIDQNVGELLDLNLSEHAETLVDHGLADLGVHVASGWVAEMTLLMKGHSNPLISQPDRKLQFDFLRSLAQPFDPVVSSMFAFFSRDEASRYLASEAKMRRLWEAPFSPFRHLARFRWPQSLLFPAQSEYVASQAQLFHFVRGKWPVCDEDDFLHRAVAECLRYGAPAEFASDVRFTV